MNPLVDSQFKYFQTYCLWTFIMYTLWYEQNISIALNRTYTIGSEKGLFRSRLDREHHNKMQSTQRNIKSWSAIEKTPRNGKKKEKNVT